MNDKNAPLSVPTTVQWSTHSGKEEMQKERERESILKLTRRRAFQSVKHAREKRNISIVEGGKGGGGYLGEED